MDNSREPQGRPWQKGDPEPGENPALPDDEITREQIEALNRIVPDDEFSDYKTISGPAW